MLLRDIKIDPEFRQRLRQQTPDEAAAMTQSIDDNGFINPLIVWSGHGLLIDGHHRFKDWQRRQDEYEVLKPKWAIAGLLTRNQPKPPPQPDFIQMEFKDRDEVLALIDTLQYAKRNLSESEMAFLRAKFIGRVKGTMSEAEAVKVSVEKHNICERTARRDAEHCKDIETVEPIVLEATGQTLRAIQSSPEPMSRGAIHEVAKIAEIDPAAALKVVQVTRTAKDKRCKPRLDGAETPKPPAWEKHLVLLTKSLETLWKDSVDEERRTARAKLNDLIANLRRLDASLKAAEKTSAA